MILKGISFFKELLSEDKSIKVLYGAFNIGSISSVCDWYQYKLKVHPSNPSLCHCSVLQGNYFKLKLY